MSILTEEEMFKMIVDNPDETMLEFARSIESAVLAKLAGMELPWGDDIEAWLEVRTGAEIAAAFHQAFAQGAASQLMAEPVAWMVDSETQHGTKTTYPLTGRYKDVCDACDFGEPVPLYTLKEPK